MDGQGMAAFPAPPGGRPRVIGLGSVDSPGLVDTASHVTSDIADRGEVRERNGDDSDVMVAPSYPEGSAQDAARQSPQSQLPHAELPSRQIKPDKADNIVDPDRDDNAVARDENTGHNQATGSPATGSPATGSPATGSPAAASPGTTEPPGTAGSPGTGTPAAAGSALPRGPWADRAAQAGRQSRSSEPETVQFPAVPGEYPEAPAGPIPTGNAEPAAAGPAPSAEPAPAEPATEQFAAIPPPGSEPPAPEPPAPEPAPRPRPPRPPRATSAWTRACSRPP